VLGAFTAQRELTKPFEKAKSDRLASLNQSDLKSQEGPTSKAIKKKIGTKMSLENEQKFTSLFRMSKVGLPPIFLPIVSKTLKMVA
jgi:hypothetical protein